MYKVELLLWTEEVRQPEESESMVGTDKTIISGT